MDNEVEGEERTEVYLYVAVPRGAMAVIVPVDSAESHGALVFVFGIEQVADDKSHQSFLCLFWEDHVFAYLSCFQVSNRQEKYECSDAHGE